MTLGNIELTRSQSRHIDEVASVTLKIPSLILMENAGRGAAEWICETYKEVLTEDSARVQVVCGTGNNGGDGLVIARHLHNCGCAVSVWIVGDRTRLTHDASVNLSIILAMGLNIIDIVDAEGVDRACQTFGKRDVIVDAMLGTGFSGDVREPMATIIRRINECHCDRVVAIDVPSGLDCDSGTIGNVGIRASATMTFVAPKVGFKIPPAREYLGKVVVKGIGIPPSLVQDVVADHSQGEQLGA
ncbi:MAG TPA: NAD(P)H-hydrate epimerase [Phycisphaerae bacterium]|nr:NAD(P)H-hydrate epimerase [Phycisphaerales bacterium]HNO79509.1 NAD(P)H-hydrate epimerase [Phycisphaerae bacterium]